MTTLLSTVAEWRPQQTCPYKSRQAECQKTASRSLKPSFMFNISWWHSSGSFFTWAEGGFV